VKQEKKVHQFKRPKIYVPHNLNINRSLPNKVFIFNMGQGTVCMWSKAPYSVQAEEFTVPKTVYN